MICLSTIVLALTLFSAGCNRNDADSLGRIGRKLAARGKDSAGDVGAKFDLSLPASKKEPTLQEKIQDRLRYENTLTDVTLEVSVKEKEVELKGTVKTALQRQTAINLTDTVAGVGKVVDSIKVLELEETPK
jgi:hypothetical protein